MAESTQAELTPAELDQLEDALAELSGLEIGEVGEVGAGLTPALRSRLGEYREVLLLAREAMPMVEVPSGLLDAALAEARASAAEPTAAARPGAGLWERLRRSFVVPGFALAATAVILVVALRPDSEDMSQTPGMIEAAEDARVEPVVTPARGDAQAPPPAAAPAELAADEGIAEEEAAPKAERREPAPGGALGAGLPAAARAPVEAAKPRPSKKSKASLDDAFGGAPATKEDAKEARVDQDDKGSVRALLDKADKLRRAGRCGEASAAYRQLEGVGGASEAQALVGLGLCAEFGGDEAGASAYFARARGLAAVDALIAVGRKQMDELGATKKASKLNVPLD